MFRHILLGVVQGVTEFLPISSSGHLVIAQELLGLSGPRTFFDALLHFATLIAVLIVYRSRIAHLGRDLFSAESGGEGRKYLALLVVATLPVVLIGLLAKERVERAFGSTLVAGIGLVGTGAILWISKYARRAQKEVTDLSLKGSLLIGIAQAGALIPGVSRSGITISAGLFSRLKGERAAEFSFLLMIPAVTGATLLQLWDFLQSPTIAQVSPVAYVAGGLSATLTGALAIKFLLRVLENRENFSKFAYYCFAAGGSVLLYNLFL